MGQFSRTIIGLLSKREAASQGGLLNGEDPTTVNKSDPLRLWIIQLGVIVGTATLLSLVLRKIRQPKVIAEVLGGILLGPTAFGRIPGFTEHIFPTDSIPYLTLTADIGLCLFLFLVGLEIDMSVIKKNARLSVTVALAGMVLPFGAGAGLAVALYRQFIDIPDSGTGEAGGQVKFTHFMLFTGVAYSITAFPVLCRILTELKLLDTTVGVVVLSAGVGNDIIGWILLALSVALVNAGSGLTALYILLICVGWSIVLLIPGKRALLWLARQTGSTDGHGPSMFFMTVTMIVVFGSAFFTDVIGVQAIFGAFLAGMMVPREGGLAIALTEKLEDMVTILFLPLYFTLSGLSTDLGLLNNGITWAYTVAICALAFTGKFGGCSLAARFLAGFSWRESGAIGALMSCKGLVELIVLNVGLSAGILSRRVFSMFVLEALLLTFMTTPLVTILYPPHKRVRASPTGANFNNVPGGDAETGDEEPMSAKDRKSREEGSKEESDSRKEASPEIQDDDDLLAYKKTSITIVLDKIEHLPGMMAITQLLKPSLSQSSHQHNISALRLIELSDRTSAVMKSISNVHEQDYSSDPLLAIYTMFGALNDLFVKPLLEIVPWEDLAGSVVECATRAKFSSWTGRRTSGGEMVLVPWLPPTHHRHGPLPSPQPVTTPGTPAAGLGGYNPFDALFKVAGTAGVGGGNAEVGYDRGATLTHAHFVRSIFSKARDDVDVGLYMELSSSSTPSGLGPLGMHHQQRVHILLPFFGGPDDRLALDLVAQLCENERVEATCLRVVKREVEAPLVGDVSQAHLKDDKDGFPAKQELHSPTPPALTVASARSARSTAISGFPDTVYGHANTAMRMQSETADNLWWGRFKDHPSRVAATTDSNSTSTPSASSGSFPTSSALSRMHFKDLASPIPLHAVIAEANRINSASASTTSQKLLVVAGRSRRMAVESHVKELKTLVEEYSGGAAGHLGSEVKKTVGDVASAMILAGCAEGLVVVQAKSGEV